MWVMRERHYITRAKDGKFFDLRFKQRPTEAAIQ